jgi:hypothetical protein
MQILSSRVSILSARLLASAYTEIYNKKCKVTKYIEKINIKEPYIRYGSLSVKMNTEDGNYNSVGFVHTCCDKLYFASLMEVNNIPSPKFNKEKPTKYPILIRTTLTGHGGIGIHKVFNEEEYQRFKGHYWTPLLNVKKEYRAHILGGKISRLFRKVLQDQSVEEGDYPIRNSHEGYHFRLLDHASTPKLVSFCNSIAEKVMGKFYALDIGLLEDGSLMVFEANSAPGLNNNTVKDYITFIVDDMKEVLNAVRRTTEDTTRIGRIDTSNQG